MESPLKYFAELKDPRVERTREHVREEILLIAIAAILSGAGGWNEIENYGRAKSDWLRTFLTLPSGIPSHDTFNRVFAALDPQELEKGFMSWVASIARLTAGEVVAIDGKALRGTRKAAIRALCIRFRPGPTPATWCWPSAKWMTSPTRSPRFPGCWRRWN